MMNTSILSMKYIGKITKYEDERFPDQWTTILDIDGDFAGREFNEDGDVIYL